MSKVSIIIPCYNQGEYVSDAIESSINQSYNDIEIIVVNDASSDDSANIINSYAEKYENIKFINNPKNKGVIFCRNLAVENATGEFILPLDADDRIAPEYVEKAVKVFSSNPEIKIVYCRSMLFGNKNEEFKLQKISLENIVLANCIPNSAMFKKSDFISVNGYKSYMKKGWEDWDLWLSIIETAKNKKDCVYRIDEILFYYRQYSETVSRNNFDENIRLELLKNIFNNHLELFKENDEFIERTFYFSPKKYKKYRNLYKLFMYTTVFCLFSLLIILIFWSQV